MGKAMQQELRGENTTQPHVCLNKFWTLFADMQHFLQKAHTGWQVVNGKRAQETTKETKRIKEIQKYIQIYKEKGISNNEQNKRKIESTDVATSHPYIIHQQKTLETGNYKQKQTQENTLIDDSENNS